MNCEDPLLRDARVRRAIAMAIDREAIVAAKFRGYAVLSTTLLPSSHWAHAKDVPPLRFDQAAARALLAEAGALGKRVVLKTSTSSKFRVAIARVLAKQLAEAGLDVEVRAYEFQTFFTDVKSGNAQIFLLQLPEVTDPHVYYNFFHSSRIPPRENLDAGGNRFRFRDARVDELLERGRRAEEKEERRHIYAEVQRHLADLMPAVPLWHEDNVAVMGRGVQGYELWPNARFSAMAGVWKEGYE
jgi:peptide/nickel transport system substrate-binding protein